MLADRVRSARWLTGLVWLSGSGIIAFFIRGVIGWSDNQQQRTVDDLVLAPITVLTAALGAWLVLKGNLSNPERRSWAFLEMAFLINSAAHVIQLIDDSGPEGTPSPRRPTICSPLP